MRKWMRHYKNKHEGVFRISKFERVYGEWVENLKRKQDEDCSYQIQFLKNDDHLEILPETWLQSLEIAKKNGWIPKGTLPPKCDCGYFCVCREIWHGRYDTCEDQYMTQEDALSYAEALQCAISSGDTVIDVDWIWLMGCPGEPKRNVGSSLLDEIEQVVQHKQKTTLVRLINFCRRGGEFSIGEVAYTRLLD